MTHEVLNFIRFERPLMVTGSSGVHLPRMSAFHPSFRNDWTSEPFGAVVFAPFWSPGIAGLHSVQGEGLAFARRVEKDDVHQD